MNGRGVLTNRKWRAALLAVAQCLALLGAAQCPGFRPVFSWASDGSAIAFTDETQAVIGASIAEHHWHFGDGDSATGAFATHVYDSAGADTVRLTILAEGCSFTVSALVAHAGDTETCTSAISSGFSVSALGNNHLALTDQSQSDAPFVLYLWTFGDGNTSLDQHTEHFWTLPGAYDVSHSIGALNDQLQTTCVAGRAERLFVDGNTSTCDSSLFFGLSASVQDGQAVLNADAIPLNEDIILLDWTWDYGDASGDLSAIPNAEHGYAYGGEYQVCVDVRAARPSMADTCWARACGAIFLTMAVGVEEATGPPSLHAAPVPFADELRLTGDAVRYGTAWIMRDALGRVVLSGRFANDGAAAISTGPLPGGLYVLSAGGAAGPIALPVLKR